jgi:hypothetical protein
MVWCRTVRQVLMGRSDLLSKAMVPTRDADGMKQKMLSPADERDGGINRTNASVDVCCESRKSKAESIDTGLSITTNESRRGLGVRTLNHRPITRLP